MDHLLGWGAGGGSLYAGTGELCAGAEAPFLSPRKSTTEVALPCEPFASVLRYAKDDVEDGFCFLHSSDQEPG